MYISAGHAEGPASLEPLGIRPGPLRLLPAVLSVCLPICQARTLGFPARACARLPVAWCRAGGGRGEWQAPGRRCDCCYTMNHPQTGGVDNRLVTLSECVGQRVAQGTAGRARLRDVQGLGCVIPLQALRPSEASSLTRLAWTLPPTRPLPGRPLEHSCVSLLLGLGFLTEWWPQRGGFLTWRLRAGGRGCPG